VFFLALYVGRLFASTLSQWMEWPLRGLNYYVAFLCAAAATHGFVEWRKSRHAKTLPPHLRPGQPPVARLDELHDQATREGYIPHDYEVSATYADQGYALMRQWHQEGPSLLIRCASPALLKRLEAHYGETP